MNKFYFLLNRIVNDKIFSFSICVLALLIITLPAGIIAVVICALSAALIICFIHLGESDGEMRQFLTNLFIGAFIIRIIFALTIFTLNLQPDFGPDALYYDFLGNELVNSWSGQASAIVLDYTKSGWGMPYAVGGIYFAIGHNPLAAQLILSVFGAVASLLAFLCARQIFHNNRVAKYTGLFVAFFPGMIIWTSQLLKDGLIIFFLVLALLAALHLQQRLNYIWIFYLLFSLRALSSLRFYIFLMVAAAVLGGFILGFKTSGQSLVSRFVVCIAVGLAFNFLGVWSLSEQQVSKYGNLEKIQDSRHWAAKSANSGLDTTIDVSTSEGLITALPMGIVNLFLAPFPWQVTSLTQVLTMPEMIVWWCSLPFIISGIAYTLKNRFRECASVLFFTLMLSVSYAVYQGNIGTLYRQRAQIQVFLLIFAAVGLAMRIEKKENIKSRANVRRLYQKLTLTK